MLCIYIYLYNTATVVLLRFILLHKIMYYNSPSSFSIVIPKNIHSRGVSALLGKDEKLMCRRNASSSSKILSIIIETLTGRLVFPAGIVNCNSPC